MPGFPIRTSSDHRSVDTSPRHIAASHVLHRLPVPRHPPCALKHLQKPKMSKNCTSDAHKKALTLRKEREHSCALDARNHYPQIKHHTPPPRWSDNNTHHHRQPPDPKQDQTPIAMRAGATPPQGDGAARLLPQSPTVCLMTPPTRTTFAQTVFEFALQLYAPDHHPLQATAIHRFTHGRGTPHNVDRPGFRGAP